MEKALIDQHWRKNPTILYYRACCGKKARPCFKRSRETEGRRQWEKTFEKRLHHGSDGKNASEFRLGASTARLVSLLGKHPRRIGKSEGESVKGRENERLQKGKHRGEATRKGGVSTAK